MPDVSAGLFKFVISKVFTFTFSPAGVLNMPPTLGSSKFSPINLEGLFKVCVFSKPPPLTSAIAVILLFTILTRSIALLSFL